MERLSSFILVSCSLESRDVQVTVRKSIEGACPGILGARLRLCNEMRAHSPFEWGISGPRTHFSWRGPALAHA
jgi:hypothetical protein